MMKKVVQISLSETRKALSSEEVRYLDRGFRENLCTVQLGELVKRVCHCPVGKAGAGPGGDNLAFSLQKLCCNWLYNWDSTDSVLRDVKSQSILLLFAKVFAFVEQLAPKLSFTVLPQKKNESIRNFTGEKVMNIYISLFSVSNV